MPELFAEVDHVEIYYCLDNDWPTTRYWRSVTDVQRKNGSFSGETPCLENTESITAIANVY